jgi:nitrate/TMAO reductase-like tetraheme cytochrome c subunit
MTSEGTTLQLPMPSRTPLLLLLALSLALLFPGRPAGAAEAEVEDACTACHRDPTFLVKNKKLYDYFQQWDGSIHQQEGVTCQKCHGGNPKTTNKDQAHSAGVAASDASSGIYYAKIPQTCGKCHEDILEGFQKSNHYEHVAPEEEDEQGPTCVTCHGSIDAEILDVNSVEAACARCHNFETDNNPDTTSKRTTTPTFPRRPETPSTSSSPSIASIATSRSRPNRTKPRSSSRTWIPGCAASR